MAWTETGKNTLGRRVLAESTVQGNAATVYSSSFQVKKGQDFTVIGNTLAVNTVGAITVEVQVSHDNSTFATVTTTFMTTLDTLTKASFYDNSLQGDAPYYRLAMAAAGNDSANSLEMIIIV